MKPHCSPLLTAAWLPATGSTCVLADDRRSMQLGYRVFGGQVVGSENLASEASD
jgi:hypothetical protein